jgi:hypothetical protein
MNTFQAIKSVSIMVSSKHILQKQLKGFGMAYVSYNIEEDSSQQVRLLLHCSNPETTDLI